MDYYGEQLLPGQLGHFFIVLSLVASLVATFSYFKAAQAKTGDDSGYWKRLARYAFITEVVSVFAIFGILFYIIFNHLFEYKYAWQHSSRSLEFKYILACFWEGQEGSFLLWSIWHCILGLIFIRSGKKWESPVMAVISFSQFCLATMIAGIYIFDWKLGSNPFILLRDSGIFDNAPALHVNFDVNQPLRPDYLRSVTDGNDLNPLLQNYWMVIHPPVLFLGFASAIFPFAFAIAGLWKKDYGEWTKPALPWALFAAAVLGVGIMMGGAWAYESLTFGGYWAWDPVENASLVPWLILIAGIHTLLIYKHSGYSLRSTVFFFLLSYVFVIYSTFLTRSGVLGETSVHAFTDLGMNFQLFTFLFLFTVPALILFIKRYKKIPAIKKEEHTSSREFWMFIGSLVFFLSAILIIFKTSLPVLNKVFAGLYSLIPLDILKRTFAPPEDPEFSYNQIQIFVAIITAVLTGLIQYLRYRETSKSFFWKKFRLPAVLAVLLSGAVLLLAGIDYQAHGPMFLGAIWLATACSLFAIVANIAYIWLGLKGRLALSGGSIAHFGFGMILLGILLSSAKKEILSYNTSGIAIDFGKESNEKTGENLTLVKGFPMKMGKYDVTYLGDSAHPKKQQWYFQIHFKSRTDNEEFTLWPNAFVNYKGNEGLMANPDARHYLTHDVFAYVSALPNPEKNVDTSAFTKKIMRPGDSIFYSRGFVILENLVTSDSIPLAGFEPGDKASVATLKVHSSSNTYEARALLFEKKGIPFSQPDTVMSQSLILQMTKADQSSAEIGIKESGSVLEYVTLKAYKFPYIKVLWAGIIITAIGILISMARRIRLNRKTGE